MEEFKIYKKTSSKLVSASVLILFAGFTALFGYVAKAYDHLGIAIILWICAAVLIGGMLCIFIINVRLYNDRIVIASIISKTVYFRDVSTIDVVDGNLVFRDSSEKVLVSITHQYVALEFSAILNFIMKHNPHIKLGASFISDEKLNEIIDIAAQKRLEKLIELLPDEFPEEEK